MEGWDYACVKGCGMGLITVDIKIHIASLSVHRNQPPALYTPVQFSFVFDNSMLQGARVSRMRLQ